MRHSSLAVAAAISLLPCAAFAQNFDAGGGFGGAVRGSSFLSPTPIAESAGAPAVISGPVGAGAVNASAGSIDAVRVWGKTFGFSTHVGGDANGPAWTTKGGGAAVGIERLVMPNFLLGAAFGYTGTSTGNALQDVKAETLSGALYASWIANGFETNGLVGINGNRYDSARILNLGGTPTGFSGGARGLGYSVYGDFGYRFQTPTLLGPGYAKPFVGVNYSSLRRDQSTEFSAGGLDLVYQGQTFERFSTLAGVDFGSTIALAGGFIRPEFRIGWVHEYIDPAPPVFASLAGIPLTTRDPQPGNDGLVVGAQTTMWSKQNLQFFVGYTGEFRRNLETHQGQAGIRVSW